MSHCTSLGRRKGIAKTKQRIAAIFSLFHITPPMEVWNPPKKNISETHTNYKEWQKLQSLQTKIRTQTSN